eukprot:m.820700 g.820700  ORF g.820700 m.820700 type:complete len:407 (-) comp23397_c0_seq9:349-1569(-)
MHGGVVQTDGTTVTRLLRWFAGKHVVTFFESCVQCAYVLGDCRNGCVYTKMTRRNSTQRTRRATGAPKRQTRTSSPDTSAASTTGTNVNAPEYYAAGAVHPESGAPVVVYNSPPVYGSAVPPGAMYAAPTGEMYPVDVAGAHGPYVSGMTYYAYDYGAAAYADAAPAVDGAAPDDNGEVPPQSGAAPDKSGMEPPPSGGAPVADTDTSREDARPERGNKEPLATHDGGGRMVRQHSLSASLSSLTSIVSEASVSSSDFLASSDAPDATSTTSTSSGTSATTVQAPVQQKKRIPTCMLCGKENAEAFNCTDCTPKLTHDEQKAIVSEYGVNIAAESDTADVTLSVRQTLWLKSLRLHKYAPLLVGKTKTWLQDTSEEEFTKMGLASGAIKKLKAKLAASDTNSPWKE